MAEGGPGGLGGDVDGVGGAGFRLGEFGGGEDGEEDERFVMGVVGAVDGSGGDVGHFTGGEDAFFFADPLFGAAVEDVDDFFAMGVVVEGVAVAGGSGGTVGVGRVAAAAWRAQACSLEPRGTPASRKSIWSATMRRPRRIMSSCRLGT